ncbi:uncharacterized protein LOC105385571 [Plutella xylostella]|uniref:uncharacterized protein LOC105385571 n=1 Tax=Plutella xylostella TaxID=51655 RepID=UPI002033026B|nr:uncharacterized protein LOC105385571 [Plutella xylostella]
MKTNRYRQLQRLNVVLQRQGLEKITLKNMLAVLFMYGKFTSYIWLDTTTKCYGRWFSSTLSCYGDDGNFIGYFPNTSTTLVPPEKPTTPKSKDKNPV